MGLRRASRRHTSGVNSEEYWAFAPGDRVKVIEGFLGTVTAVEDGPHPGAEQYVIELDAGMGGGEWSPDELQPVEQTTASKTASSGCSACEGTGEQGNGHECYICDGSGTADAEAEGRAAGVTNDNPENGLPEGIDKSASVEFEPSDGSIPHALWHVQGRTWRDAWTAYDAMGLDFGDAADIMRSAMKPGTPMVEVEDPDGNRKRYKDDASARRAVQRALEGKYLASKSAAYRLPDGSPITVADMEAIAIEHLGLTPADLQRAQADNHGTYEGHWLPQKVKDVLYRLWGAGDLGIDTRTPRNTEGYEYPERTAAAEASIEHIASEDYPELSEILVERPSLAHSERIASKTAGFFDKVMNHWGDQMLERQQENGVATYNPETGEFPSRDWCRFRKNSRCFYPKTLHEEATKIEGYAVWVPEDRGYCPRPAWEGKAGQKGCPVGEPGPNSGEPNARLDATVPWEQGGQRGGIVSVRVDITPRSAAQVDQSVEEMSTPNVQVDDETFASDLVEIVKERRRQRANPYGRGGGNPYTSSLVEGEFTWHFTARWRDVQAKAKRIKDDGHVRVISSTPTILVGEVRGDTNVYQASLLREPGSQRIAMWECGCAWAAYSWGRSGRWRKYEGRLCSHALALNYEGQSQGWEGGEVTEHDSLPAWRSDPSVTVKVPGDYKREDVGPWRVGSLDDETTVRMVATDTSIHDAPALGVAQDMLSDGDDPNEILATLLALGVGHAEAAGVLAMSARPFEVKVRNQIVPVLDLLDGGLVETGAGIVPASDCLHPKYHPTLGLNPPYASLQGREAAQDGLVAPSDLQVGQTVVHDEYGYLGPLTIDALDVEEGDEYDTFNFGFVNADGNSFGMAVYTDDDPKFRVVGSTEAPFRLTASEEFERRETTEDDGVLYHVAPSSVRDAIAAHGIDWSRGEERWPGVDYPKGNYLFRDLDGLEEAKFFQELWANHYGYPFDVWEVRIGSIPLLIDPLFFGQTRYTEQPIPVTQIRQVAAKNDGCMVALEIPKAMATALYEQMADRYDAGDIEAPVEYHITLAYPGKADEVDCTALETATRDWAKRWGPMTGRLSGYGVFHQDGGDKVLVALVDIPGMERARDDLITTLSRWGIAIPDDHGFTPHLTLGYFGEANTPEIPDNMPEECQEEFTISEASLVIGDTWKHVSLETSWTEDIGSARDLPWGFLPWGGGDFEWGGGTWAGDGIGPGYDPSIGVGAPETAGSWAGDLVVAHTNPYAPPMTIERTEYLDPFMDTGVEHRLSDYSWVYTAKVRDESIGTMRLRERLAEPGVWEVWRIHVKDEWRRQGVASDLLAQARADLLMVEHAPMSERTEDGRSWSQTVGKKDRTVPPSEHGIAAIEEAGVTLSEDDKGYYVHTHRARSDSYDTPGDIPQSKIDFIDSTGSLHTAAPSGIKYLATSNHPSGALDRSYSMLGAFLDGEMIAYMTWGLQGRQIQSVFVKPAYRRQGIAEAMVRLARTADPGITTHPDRTDAGNSWSESMFPYAPEREHNTTEEDYGDEGNGSLIEERLLSPHNPDDVIDLSPMARYVAAVGDTRYDLSLYDGESFESARGTVVADYSDEFSFEGAYLREDEVRAIGEAALAERKDDPEPALPETTADEEPVEDFTGDETTVADDPDIGMPAAVVNEDPDDQGEIVPGDPRLAHLMGGSAPTTSGDKEMNIAQAARAHLAKTALKAFTPAEQAAIINEGEGVTAANLDLLDISGTHYEALEQAFTEAAAEPDDETWLL